MKQEKLLINRILKGDTSSFSYFVDVYQDMALTIAFRICKNTQDAEDIVQNSFVKAFHNLHTFQASSKFSTWFYRIVYNTAINAMKERNLYDSRFVEYSSMIENVSASSANSISILEEKERKEIINEAIDSLPPSEAVILTLYYVDDKPIKDIALIVGLTEANIKVRLHRARKKLKTLLENSIDIPKI